MCITSYTNTKWYYLGFITNTRHQGYSMDTKKVNMVKINQEGLYGFEKETGRRKGQRWGGRGCSPPPVMWKSWLTNLKKIKILSSASLRPEGKADHLKPLQSSHPKARTHAGLGDDQQDSTLPKGRWSTGEFLHNWTITINPHWKQDSENTSQHRWSRARWPRRTIVCLWTCAYQPGNHRSVHLAFLITSQRDSVWTSNT